MTRFRKVPLLLAVYGLLGAVMIVLGIATAAFFVLVDRGEWTIRLVALGLSAVVVWLGWWFAAQVVRRMREPGSPIVIGPDGLHDRALSERPIAWSDIVEPRLVHTGRGGTIFAFDLADGAEERAGVYRRMRVAAKVNRQFGYTHQVHGLGTNAGIVKLVAAVAPYAPVLTEGRRASWPKL